MKKPRFQPDLFLAAILAAAGLLIFWGLGTRDLWEDEAETALLAKNILRSGLPVAFDGLNLVSVEAGKDLGPGGLSRWSPWLQYYLAAASMKLFGATTLAARLPFACLGFLCLPMTYYLALGFFDSVRVARLSALLLSLCVPFLLHIRQARWYGAAYLSILLLFQGFLYIENEDEYGVPLYVFSGVLLFYANYFIAIGVLLSLLAASSFWKVSKRLVIADLWVVLFALPGLYFFDVLGKPAGFEIGRALEQSWAYAGGFLTFLLPLPLLFLGRRDRRTRFLLAVCGLFIAYLSLAPWKAFRYLSILAPVTALLAASAVDKTMTRDRRAGTLLLAAVAFCGVLHMLPLELFKTSGTAVADSFPSAGPVRFPIIGYVYEITHPLDTCDRAVTDYLQKNAGPKDVVIATYGDLPLQFYTGLQVLGGFQGRTLPADPDWIVLHPSVMDRRPGRDVDVARFLLSRVDMSRYRKVDLRCVDAMLGGSAEPVYHVVKGASAGPSLSFYRKI